MTHHAYQQAFKGQDKSKYHKKKAGSKHSIKLYQSSLVFQQESIKASSSELEFSICQFSMVFKELFLVS